MSKHTPGTWEVAPATVQVSVPCDNGGGRRNVQMHSVQSTAFSAGGGIALVRTEADARLVSAAKDLLEACKNMLWHEDKYAARKQAEAAIAKAEGR